MTRYTDEQQRSQTMSTFGALNSVGVIVGPFLTTLLLAWGILAPLWAAIIILSLISLVIVFGYERNSSLQSSKQDPELWKPVAIWTFPCSNVLSGCCLVLVSIWQL